MNIKVVSTLVSMAFISVVAYIFALFSIPMAHAADFIVSDHLAIEAGSLKPLQVDVQTEVGGNVNTSTTGNAEVKVKSNNSMNATVVSPSSNSAAYVRANIANSTDLDAYTRDLAREDENVSNVEVKDTSVAVSYKEPARIFGLIPTEVTVTVVAQDNGTVTVHYPWYAFLSGKNTGSLKPGLQMHIGEVLKSAQVSTSASATTTAEISPQVRAQFIHAIHTALKDFRANATTTYTSSL